MNSMESDSEKNADSEMENNYVSKERDQVLETQEIGDKELEVIKGDSIGETLYSASWILKTLISLSNAHEDGWNECLENDMCTLWDMSAEKDIVNFLLENDFLKIANFTLKTSEEPRLMEIIVGIIGNMCCKTDALETLVNEEELVSIVLSFISCDDKETLIQVLRILQAATWDIKKDPNSLWLKRIEECKYLGEAISFILKSSTSDDLIMPTVDLVYLISETELNRPMSFLEIVFDIDHLILSLCEAMIEIINQQEIGHTESQLGFVENWFNIVFNIVKQNLLKFTDCNDENFKKLNLVLLKVLQPYKNLNNLMPLEEKCLVSIRHCMKMIFSFQTNEMFPDAAVICSVLKIMVNSKTAMTDGEFSNCADLEQLYNYIVNYWLETLKIVNREQINEIISLCDLQTVKSIMEITKSSSGISEDCINKFSQSVSAISIS